MGDRIANPNALGFSAFAIIAWMQSMLFAGWYDPGTASATIHGFVSFALIGLFIAALAAFLRNATWHAVFFMFWAAVIWGLRGNQALAMPTSYGAWYALGIALVSFFLLLAALRVAAGPAATLINLGAALQFLAMALAGWLGGTFWIGLGGYIGLVTAVVALWAAWGAFAEMGGEASPAAM